MIIDPRDKKELPDQKKQISPGVTPSNFSSLQSGFELSERTDVAIAAKRNEVELYEDIVKKANKNTPDDVNFENPLGARGALGRDPFGLGGSVTGEDDILSEWYAPKERLNEFWKKYNKYRDNLPKGSIARRANQNNISKIITERLQGTVKEAEEMRRREDLSNTISRFIGGTGAFFTDPITLTGIALGNVAARSTSAGTFGLGSLNTWARNTLIEAGFETLAEGAAQPFVQNYREKHGLEHGPLRATQNIVSAGIGEVALGGGLRLGGKGVNKVVKGAGEKLKNMTKNTDKLIEEYDKMPKEVKTEKTENAKYALQMSKQIYESNPFEKEIDGGINKGETRHVENLGEAFEKIRRGKQPNINVEDNPPVEVQRELDGGAYAEQVKMEDVKLEPETFQFKSQADEQGVTGTLTEEDEWADLTDRIIVFQRENGDKVVADGHQRTNLAKRLMEEGKEEDIVTGAYVFRESDGFTPEEVKKIAALKNYRDGFANAVDAARIVKKEEEFLERLPNRSALLRDTKRLKKLDSESLDKIVRDDIPANQAAMVGRVASDLNVDQEKALIDLLNRKKPSNLNEARSMVDQAKMGFKSEKQETLFGEEEMTDTLFEERAKVYDNAIRKIKNERATFNKLLKEKDKIESEGKNVVDEDTSKNIVENAKEMIELIKTQGNKKGEISDALTDAARSLEENGNITDSVDKFVERVNQAIRRGDISGRSFESSGSVGRSEPEVEQGTAETEGPAEQQTKHQSSLIDESEETVEQRADNIEQETEELKNRVQQQIDQITESEEEGTIKQAKKEWMELEGKENFEDIEVVMDAEGKETKSLSEVVKDLEKDDEYLDEIGDCL